MSEPKSKSIDPVKDQAPPVVDQAPKPDHEVVEVDGKLRKVRRSPLPGGMVNTEYLD